MHMCRLGDTGFFRLQGIVKTTVSRVLEDLKFKNSEGFGPIAEKTSQAESGQHKFWSEPSEILNFRSSNTPKTAAFNIP